MAARAGEVSIGEGRDRTDAVRRAKALPAPWGSYEARKQALGERGLTPAEYERECARIARELGL
jgi:hypothetical protein